MNRADYLRKLGLLLALLVAANAWGDPAGSVTHLTGTLSAQRGDGKRTLLAVGSAVNEGDVLDTAHDTYARIKFADNSEVVLRPDSRIRVEQYRFVPEDPSSDRSLIDLIKGGLRRISGLIGKRSPPQDKIQTPVATIGIRGTHYGLLLCRSVCSGSLSPNGESAAGEPDASACPNDCGDIPTVTGRPLKDGLHVDVANGEVALQNEQGLLPVLAGQFAYVRNRITLPVIVPPGEGVRVTMPSSIARNRGKGQTLDITNCNGQCVVP
jgi:hypothetical protein